MAQYVKLCYIVVIQSKCALYYLIILIKNTKIKTSVYN